MSSGGAERPDRATALAPACIGNLGTGFDLLGHAIEGPGDRVTAIRTRQPGVTIIDIRNAQEKLPTDADANTAGRAAVSLLQSQDTDFGVELIIDKGIPVSAGLGGSAASAVAAVVAVNALLPEPAELHELYRAAMMGESAATDSLQGDNVGPQLTGGLALGTRSRLVPMNAPEWLHAAVVHPDCRLDTRAARKVLDREFPMDLITRQQAGLALLINGCLNNNESHIAEGLNDVLVEPLRAPLVPGFAEVQRAATDSGALGATLSGAGPSVFAWCRGQDSAHRAGQAMADAFARHGLEACVYLSPVNTRGARIV